MPLTEAEAPRRRCAIGDRPGYNDPVCTSPAESCSAAIKKSHRLFLTRLPSPTNTRKKGSPMRSASLLQRLVFVGVLAATASLGVAAESSVKTLTIKAIAGLQYDTPRFRVQPGQAVELTLVNVDTMMHNLVITAPGKRMAVVQAAMKMGPDGPEQDYLPQSSDIIDATGVLNADESTTIRFNAPKDKGVYPYVCTFPGHGMVMYGAMYVGQKMPPLAEDTHVAPWASDKEQGDKADDVAVPDAVQFNQPVVVRDFLPDCGPAAMAIGLPNRTNVAFDAGKCRVRYAWQGGFIKLSYAKRDGPAKLLGEVFYRADAGFPLRLGSAEQAPEKVSFEGYRFNENGAPVLRYVADGVHIKQTIRPRKSGPGLTRVFELSNVNQPVWFVAPEDQAGKTIVSAKHTWRDGKLKLSPQAARRFEVTLVAPAITE
jgi:azurin